MSTWMIAAIAAVLVGAADDRPADDAALRAEIAAALQPPGDPNYDGVMRYTLEIWQIPPAEMEERRSVQRWSVTTDERGATRLNVTCQTPGPTDHGDAREITLTCGRTDAWSWMVSGQELLIAPSSQLSTLQSQEARLGIMDNLLKSAEVQGGSLRARDVKVGLTDLQVVDADWETPKADVRAADGIVRHVAFKRHAQQLVIDSISYARESTRYRWSFSEYRVRDGAWTAGTVEMQQTSEVSPALSLRTRYSHIEVGPRAPHETGSYFQPPALGDALASRVAAVSSFDADGVHRFDFVEWARR